MRLQKALRGLAVLAFWLAVWALAAAAVGRELLLPGPLAVGRELLGLCVTADFWLTLGGSVLRVLTGIVSAVLLGVLTGLLTHCSSLARAVLSPLMALLKSTPVASFIILALVWLGRSIVPVVIAGLIVLPVVWANTLAGLAGIDPQLVELARVSQLTRGRVLRYGITGNELTREGTAAAGKPGLQDDAGDGSRDRWNGDPSGTGSL